MSGSNVVITRIVLPLAIVGGGIAGMAGLMSMRAKASRRPPAQAALAVDVVRVSSAETTAIVEVNGVVTPAQEVTLFPEVTGRVVKIADGLQPGARFARGAMIARIDARDYELAVKQQEAGVKRAELELELEAGRRKIAKREWELLGSGQSEEAAALALRKPHFAAAKWGLDAAQSQLERAKLNLSRTVLRAPFNAVVVEERVDVGQVLTPASQVARLVGTDTLWVRVAVPVERLDVLKVPGSKATVMQSVGGGRTITREGEVLRVLGELDPQTRTAQLLVSVEKPYDVEDGELPLLSGAYVTVRIEGKPVPGIFAVPREALHGGEVLWVVDSESRLARKKIDVEWGTGNAVYVTGAISNGDRVVVTPLSLPIVGQIVDVRTEKNG